MNQGTSGHGPGDTAATEESGLAERLIRDEFPDPAPAHRVRSRRDTKHAAGDEAATPGDANGTDAGLVAASGTMAASPEDTAQVPVVEVGPSEADDTIVLGAPIIHDEFVPPRRASKSRSHRTGMLAGLGVVGALLVVLVVFAPGGSKPRLPAQSVHDVSPISASGPKTAAATTPTTAAASSTTTSTAPASSPTTTPSSKGETITTYITYTEVPGSTVPVETVTPATTASAPPQTTAPPATTTTTAPPQTTTTTAPQRCLLGLIC